MPAADHGEAVVAFIAAGGTAVTGLITYLGVRYTQRQVAQASKDAVRLEEAKVDAAAYQRARESYDGALGVLREQVNDLRTSRSDDRRDYERQLGDLRHRIEHLEQARQQDRTTIQELSVYIRNLLRLLQNAGIAHPPPPPGLNDNP